MSKIKVKILKTPKHIASEVAKKVKVLIEKNEKNGRKTVLCLPTGGTPIPVYKELIRLHKEEGLSFKNVITFNLDEYYPMKKTHDQSYHYFMHNTFFNHIDIKKENINILSGELKKEEYDDYCAEYEKKIDEHGGFDLALLGIGRTAHVAFNEPPTKGDSLTRLVVLHNKTRKDNSRFFASLKDVPQYACTMGLGTINKAKEIILIATGFHKSKIIHKTLEEPNIDMALCPAAYLRKHPNCYYYLDRAAGYRLKQIKTPWLCENPVTFEWTKQMEKAAVIWLSKKLKTPIFRLDEKSFCDNELSSLFYKYENNLGDLLERVFSKILRYVHRKKNYLLPFKKEENVVIFTPHPDDAVFSLGSTIAKLVKNRPFEDKKIKICCMTSGSNSVDNHDLMDHLRFTMLSLKSLGIKMEEQKRIQEILKEIEDLEKNPRLKESETITSLRKNIRQSEATCAFTKLGLKEEDIIFLDLPFYQKKQNHSKVDVDIILKFLKETKPTDLFVCNDLEDINSNNSKCYYALKSALDQYTDYNALYLYKGMWQEYEISQCNVFVSLAKDDFEKKMNAIYQLHSQFLKPMFPHDDKKEFFVLTKERNIKTAKDLSSLGLISYYACETFQKTTKLTDEIFSFV